MKFIEIRSRLSEWAVYSEGDGIYRATKKAADTMTSAAKLRAQFERALPEAFVLDERERTLKHRVELTLWFGVEKKEQERRTPQ